MDVIVQSVLPPEYRESLERLVFFNPRQHVARDAIVDALDSFGALAIANGPEGLGVTVSQRPDAQCLFVLVPRRGLVDLAGGLVYLRTAREELTVLHIAIAGRYCRKPRVSLGLVKCLLRTVRATAHRLRGVGRITVLYRRGRSLRLRKDPDRPDVPPQTDARRGSSQPPTLERATTAGPCPPAAPESVGSDSVLGSPASSIFSSVAPGLALRPLLNGPLAAEHPRQH